MMHWCERTARLGIWTGLKTGRFAARVLPRSWLYWFSDTLANCVFYFARGFRTRSVRNASLAFADKLSQAEVSEIARASLRHFFRDFVDIFLWSVMPAEQFRSEVPIAGGEHLDAALVKGRGTIVLTGHLGNFMLLGVRLGMQGYAVNVLVNQPRNGHFARLMGEYRAQARYNTIHARPKRDALRELSQVLRGNEIAVVIADEHRKDSGVHVPFFGHTVLARRGPATLALRTGAAVVPAYLVRDGNGRLKLTIEPELQLLRSGKNATAIRANVMCMTRWLEKTVRAYPTQWNWMNIHWQDGSRRQPSETDKPMPKTAEGHGG